MTPATETVRAPARGRRPRAEAKPLRNCEVCGETFFGRSDAITCSARCRQRRRRILAQTTTRNVPIELDEEEDVEGATAVPSRVVHALQPVSAEQMRQVGLAFLAYQIVREDFSRPPMVVILRDRNPPVQRPGLGVGAAQRYAVLGGDALDFLIALDWSPAERLGTLMKRAVTEITARGSELPVLSMEPVPCFFPATMRAGHVGVTAQMMEDEDQRWAVVVLRTREEGASSWTVAAVLGAVSVAGPGVPGAAETAGRLLQRRSSQVRKVMLEAGQA